MSTTKKNPLYAAVGAGATAFEKAKELPQRVIALPQKLQHAGVSLDVRELPKQAREQIRSIDIRELKSINLNPQALVEQAKSFSSSATERAQKAYVDFSKLGEKTLKQLRKAAPKKPAAKKPAAKVKTAAAKKPVETNAVASTTTATTSQN